ncbi:MAG: DoxX family protein [Pseudomonadota bacterium]
MTSRTRKILTWTSLLLLALPTGAAGVAKLMGTPALHESFAAMGLPDWFGYFIGAAEVAGCIGLLLPPLSVLAATYLLPIMVGAVYYHIVIDGSSPLFALVLLLLCVAVVVLRREQSIWYPFVEKK